MKITKFEASSTIMGRERTVSYDGARLSVDVSFDEVEGVVRVLESLVKQSAQPQVQAAPTPQAPAAAAEPPSVAAEPTREAPKTKTQRKVSVQPVPPPIMDPMVPPMPDVQTAVGPEAVDEVLADIDQPYEKVVNAAEKAVETAAAAKKAVERVHGFACDEEDAVTITGFNTMRKVLDYLRGKYAFEDVDQFVGACEAVMDTASPVPPLLERVGRDNLRGRIETALAASKGA